MTVMLEYAVIEDLDTEVCSKIAQIGSEHNSLEKEDQVRCTSQDIHPEVTYSVTTLASTNFNNPKRTNSPILTFYNAVDSYGPL